MISFLIILAASGLVVGALARLALPGPDPMTLPETMLVGVAGSFAAGLIARLLFGWSGASILLSV
ncbi:MAG: GlsB/YeaQ/YmgE family stress response membrane protein, partial [Solirubrobacteraceae bacterium]